MEHQIVHDFFTQRLSLLLRESGKTLREVSDDTLITRSTLSNYCQGHREPGITIVHTLADYFGVSTDWLLGRTEVRTTDASLRAICDATGLTQEHAEMLIAWNRDHREAKAHHERGTTQTEIANRLFGFFTMPEVITALVQIDSVRKKPRPSAGVRPETGLTLRRQAAEAGCALLSGSAFIEFRCHQLEKAFSRYLSILFARPERGYRSVYFDSDVDGDLPPAD